MKRNIPVVPAVRMKNEEDDKVKIYCPLQSCGKSYQEMRNWRKHFRQKHGSSVDENVEERLREAQEEINKRMGKLIERLEVVNNGLKAIVNRVLMIRASQSLIRRSIKILHRKNY